jgi:hypothetical protein
MAGTFETMREISENRRLQRYVVLISSLGFLALTIAVLAVYSDPMKGYEYSIYNSTPLIFWLSIVFCQLTGILLFYTYYGTRSRLWSVGLFQIILSNFVLMTLYVYKGFIYLERTDSLSYVGYAKDIVNLGHFPSFNFYPFASIIMSMAGEAAGQGMIAMSQFLPALFFSAYTVGILCWARTIISRPMFVTSTMLASMPIFFAWFIPTLFNETLCVLMLPLFFFILWKSMDGDARYKGLVALFIVFFVIGHPLVAMTVLLFLGVVLINDLVTKRRIRSISPYMIAYGFVLLFGWIVFHALLVKDLRNIVEQLLGFADGFTTFGSASSQASRMGILSTIRSVLMCVADDLAFVLMGMVAAVMIFRRGWRTHPMTLVVGLFLVGGAYLMAIVFMTYAHNPFRLINLNFIVIFTVPLVGYALYVLRTTGRTALARVVSVVIVFALVSTVFTAYQDPNTVFPNGSISRSEVTGSNWLVTDKDAIDYTLYTVRTNPWRYADLIYGSAYKRTDYDIYTNDRETSAHFGSFLRSNTSGLSSVYLVITEYEEQAYSRTWAQTGKFGPQDFVLLNYGTTVDHVYIGGDFKVYARSPG